MPQRQDYNETRNKGKSNAKFHDMKKGSGGMSGGEAPDAKIDESTKVTTDGATSPGKTTKRG